MNRPMARLRVPVPSRRRGAERPPGPQAPAPGRLSQIEARRSLTMRAPPRFDRRAVLLGGVAASIWAWRGGGRRAAPAPARRLTAAPASQALAPPPAAPTPLLAYEGTVPGPLIRLERGEELALSLANRLDAPTTLSFPGPRIANAFAGIAGLTQAPIEPGGEAEIRFTPPDAGFNLYLPDAGAATARQLACGSVRPDRRRRALAARRRSRSGRRSRRVAARRSGPLARRFRAGRGPRHRRRGAPRRSGSPLRPARAFVCASPTLRRRGR